MISVRRTVVGALCLPLLLLGACGDGDSEADEPSRSPSVSETPTVTPSPNETETVLPEDLPADQVTPEEIVEAWIDAYNEAHLTGDTSRMRALSNDTCLTCNSIIDAVDQIYRAGGKITVTSGDRFAEVVSADAEENSDPDVLVAVELKYHAGVTQNSKEATPSPFPDGSDSWDFYLAVSDDRWIVTDIGV